MEADRTLRLYAIVLAGLSAIASMPAWPQAGSIDPTCNGGNPVRFSVGATVVNPTAMFQLTNNGVMGYGGDTNSPYLKVFGMTPDCAVNTSFGNQGVVIDTTVYRPLVSATGKKVQSLPLVADAP